MYCSSCGKEIADDTKACPHCGAAAGEASTTRKIGLGLGIGILFAPAIFSWFTLRKGHSLRARAVSLTWCAVVLLMVFGSASTPRERCLELNKSLLEGVYGALVLQSRMVTTASRRGQAELVAESERITAEVDDVAYQMEKLNCQERFAEDEEYQKELEEHEASLKAKLEGQEQ